MNKIPDRIRYRKRIEFLLSSPTINQEYGNVSPETLAHWAKYVCVLVSGYMEQSIKEILLTHSNEKAAPSISRYVENSWPNSKNMKCDSIGEILGHFDIRWKSNFETWLAEDEQRKQCINNIVTWRNSIAHGNESNTTGVTINSVSNCFKCACALIAFIENTVTA